METITLIIATIVVVGFIVYGVMHLNNSMHEAYRSVRPRYVFRIEDEYGDVSIFVGGQRDLKALRKSGVKFAIL